MSDVATSPEAPTAARGPGLWIVLILIVLGLAGTALLAGGFWLDDDPTTDLTPLQADLDDLETGPGSPIPE